MIFESEEHNYDSVKSNTWQPAFIHIIADFEVGDIVYLNSNPESPMVVLNMDYENNKINTCDVNIHNIQNTFRPECLQLYADISFRRLRRTPFIINLN